eukprot:scaffold13361_cov78-Cyclotella_meneghiniana.AAC.5
MWQSSCHGSGGAQRESASLKDLSKVAPATGGSVPPMWASIEKVYPLGGVHIFYSRQLIENRDSGD